LSDTPDEGAPVLTLAPFEESVRSSLTALLENPRLNRRQGVPGVGESHPLGWTPEHLSFVVRHTDALLGVAELQLDDDEPGRWSLGVTLDHHANKGDAGRCAAVVVEYGFTQLKAETVWFWVRRDNIAVQRFGARLGFECVCTINVPGGAPCELFELDRARWLLSRPAALMHYLRFPVVLSDGERQFMGHHGHFEVGPA
jgi:hypothetical protein